MALEPEQRRVTRARSRLGVHLDEIDRRFHPRYLGGIAAAAIRYSRQRHPIAWSVATSAAIATAVGLVAWAVFSDDDE